MTESRFRWPVLLVLSALLTACIEPTTTIRRERGNEVHVRGAEPQPSVGTDELYTVQAGDTLFRIAFRHQTTVDQLVAWNSIADRNRIQVGQRLRVGSPAPISVHTAAVADLAPTPAPAVTVASGEPASRGVPVDALPQVGALATSNVDPDTGVMTAAVGDAGTISRVEPYREPQPAVPPPPIPSPSVTVATTTATVSAAVASGDSDPEATLSAPAHASSVPPAGAAAAIATSSSGAPSAVRNGWSWPASGRLIATFVAGDPTRPGLDIAGSEGQAVYAAADGEVLFSGTGIIGYGELIVISHPGGLLSAYGHSRRRLVAEGAAIKRGQQIAEMGRDSSGRQLLHFEIRKAGKPVDPLAYLPAR